MPWKVVKRKCKQADGSAGSYVVVKEKSDGSTEQESCHTSEDKAKAAVRARYASKNERKEYMKITRRQLKNLIESFISGPRGTMGVPDTDPSLEIAGRSDEQRQKMTQQIHPSDPLQYDLLADTFGTVEDSDAEMYGLSPGDAYSIYKDPEGEYDKRTAHITAAGIFKGLMNASKAKAPDLFVEDRTSGSGKRISTIYTSNVSVLKEILNELQSKSGMFNVQKDPFGSGANFIEDKYVQIASNPRFQRRTTLKPMLGKYLIVVEYDKFV